MSLWSLLAVFLFSASSPALLFAWGKKTIEISGTDDWQKALDNHTIADGDHILLDAAVTYSCGLEIRNISNLSISASGPGKAIFDCKDKPQRAITVASSFAQFTVINLGFRNGINYYGGAISFTGINLVHLNISNCEFTNNTARGFFGIDGGGGLYVLGSASSFVEIRNCVFLSNFAPNSSAAGGGGACVLFNETADGAVVNVFGGEYIQNQATGRGGGVLIQIQKNASLVSNFNVLIDGGFFKGNSVTFGGGGVSLFFEAAIVSSTLTIKNGNYQGNTAIKTNGGGGIEFVFHANATNCIAKVQSSYFQNNSANNGGSVLLWHRQLAVNTSALLWNNSFVSNKAAQTGGGTQIWFESDSQNSTVSMWDEYYFGNAAAQGGGISITFWGFTSDSSISLSNLVITNNSAVVSSSDDGENGGGGGGGVIVLFEQPPLPQQRHLGIHVWISGCVFDSNAATGLGGALLANLPEGYAISNCSQCAKPSFSNTWYPPDSERCHFPNDSSVCAQYALSHKNYVQNYFVPYGQLASCSLSNITFKNNSIVGSGGGLAVLNGILALSNVYFVENSATEVAGAAFYSGTTESELYNNISYIHNTAPKQASLSLNSRGMTTIKENCNLEIVAAEHHGNESYFEVMGLGNTGDVSIDGRVYVECPPGFELRRTQVQESTEFIPQFPNAMKSTQGKYACVGCAPGFYSLQKGNSTEIAGIRLNSSFACTECPFGGNCTDGRNQIKTSKDFWAFHDEENMSWNFSRCPIGLCCAEDATSCELQSDTSSCASGRDYRVPLCGACREGYSQELRGPTCLPNSECTDYAWYLPFVVLLAAFWCFILIFTAYTKRSRVIKQGEKKKENMFSWVIPVLLFFYQNMYFLYMAQREFSDATISLVAIVPNLHLQGMDNSVVSKVCVLPHTTTQGAIAMKLVVPAMMAAMLFARYLSLKATVSCYRSKKARQRLRRIGPAAAKAVLMCYSLVVDVCGSLLHCVTVPIDQKVLFQAGNVSCKEPWVVALSVLFAIIVVPLPLLLFSLQVYVRKYQIRTRIVSSIEEPYRSSRWYWPSVVLMKRLILACIYSFASDDPTLQGLLFSAWIVIFLIMHVLLGPYKSENGNLVEGLGLTILALTAFSVLRSGAFLDGNVTLNNDAIVFSFQLGHMQLGLYLAPIGASVVLLTYEWLKKKWKVQGIWSRTANKLRIWLKVWDELELSTASSSALNVSSGNQDTAATAEDAKEILRNLEQELAKSRGERESEKEQLRMEQERYQIEIMELEQKIKEKSQVEIEVGNHDENI